VLTSAAAIVLVIQLVNLADVPPPLVREAKPLVEDVLRDIDVTVEWAGPSGAARGDAPIVRLTIVPREGGALRLREGSVMGAATRTPLGTGVAWVYYQRVLDESERYSVSVSRLLACVIAHEIGHLVRASPDHEPDGLMRAVWTAADFRRASTGGLRFATDADRPASRSGLAAAPSR
jgi:hypothetical protein